MRTLTAKMQAHLAGRSHCRAWMLRLDLNDGTVIGLTSWDEDVEFDLGDAAGEVIYQAGTGARISDVDLTLGLSPSNFEVDGPIGELVTHAAIVGGRFNRAEARLFQANPRHPGQGAIKVMLGNVSEARPEGGRFFLEVRSEQDRFNQTIGGTITPQCQADYGDARCGATVESTAATVTGVTDDLTFAVSYGGSAADDFFNFGKAEILTGGLAGTIGEIHDWEEVSAGVGTVTLFAPLAARLEVGDTLMLKRGCPRSRTACMARGRILFFRGYPDVPGTEEILRAAIPGQGSS